MERNINYDNFIAAIKAQVQERMGENAQIQVRQVLKNNGLCLMALFIQEKGIKAVPVIYLDDYYKDYQNGADVPELVDQIMEAYRRNRITEPVSIISSFVNFDKVRGRLVCKLINRERNRELLEQIPYQEFLDLAVVVYYWLEDSRLGEGSILIHQIHLNTWGVTKEKLFEIARENTRRVIQPMVFCSVKNLMEYQFGDTIELKEYTSDMYLLTNRNKWFGAVYLLYDDVLQEISQRLGDDFWVLPTSIHKCLILPSSISATREKLQTILRDNNQEVVTEEDFLSNQIYLYERTAHRLSITGEKAER